MPKNPFIEYNENVKNGVVLPKYPRSKRISTRISPEAEIKLRKVLEEYVGTDELTIGVSNLLECIGMGALLIKNPEELIDPESQVSITECRQSGYEDGYNGETDIFVQVVSQLSDEFQTAYLRGFLEGSYSRSKNESDN
jgi:hypothetical protein